MPITFAAQIEPAYNLVITEHTKGWQPRVYDVLAGGSEIQYGDEGSLPDQDDVVSAKRAACMLVSRVANTANINPRDLEWKEQVEPR